MTTDDESASAAPAAPAAPTEPFDIDGIHLQPSADGATLSYVPAQPIPELDAAGRPTLILIRTPQITTLQLGAHFDLDGATMAGLAAKIAEQFPALAAARLQPAWVKVGKASVVLADGSGAETELKTSPTSAFPPYAAVFSMPLTSAQAAEAISALGGRRGMLFVDYFLDDGGAGSPLRKRSDVASWFSGGDGMAHLRVLG